MTTCLITVVSVATSWSVRQGRKKNHWLSKINETLVIYQLSLFKVYLVTQKVVTAIQ